jgi:hypothetical protein
VADARMQELRRRAAAGDPDARARLCSEELRAGLVTRDEVHAAARLGDPGALAALGLPPDVARDPPAAIEALRDPDRIVAVVVASSRAARDVLTQARVAPALIGLADECLEALVTGRPGRSLLRRLRDAPRRGLDRVGPRALRAIAWALTSRDALGSDRGVAAAHATCAVREAFAALPPARHAALRDALVEVLLGRSM